ncbi:MAG TPA: hypothetical protein VJC15_04265 [Candidatus Paceibacterota bacterium]
MKFVGDFHIHSKYARATSPDMDLEHLDKWAKIKGIKVISTGDFTHPAWFKELKEKLEPAEPGLYKLRGVASDTRFILTTEISCVYTKNNKGRRVHLLIFAPSLEAVEKINAQLGWRGNLKADGRPIIGIDSKEVVKIALDASPDCMVIPAHCLLPGSVVHTQDNLLKKIEDIKEGDFVYTHRNRWQKVTETFKRSFKGKTYRIRPYYFREGLITTPEHPFYVLKTQKHHRSRGLSLFCRPGCVGKQHCCKGHIAREQHFIPQWVQAENLERGDVLLYPRFIQTQDREYINIQDFVSSSVFPFQMLQPELMELGGSGTSTLTMKGTRTHAMPASISLSKEFCRLVGYYLAEGSKGEDLISFTFAKHEENYLSDVRSLMESVFSLKPSKERVQEGSIELIYYSKILKEFFGNFCYQENSNKHRAWTKALPDWMLELPKEKQVEVIRGWWRGDGGYTTSRMLANQMKILFLRLGVIPSIYVDKIEDYKRRGNHFLRDREITARYDLYSLSRLTFFEDTFHLLEDPEFKQFDWKTSRRHGWVDENYIYLPIRDIAIGDYEGEVYNLEVENDNSYTTEFATVHNCWTPWFAVFGSKSGFNSLQECFDEYTKYIYAIETGLSSDPAMNWRLSKLDSIALISNSDSHSLAKIGREANVFDAEVSYGGIVDALKTKDPAKFLFTVEFFPEEGKYHYDGHRLCSVSMKPEESRAHNNMCPKCGRPLTIGVLNRVAELADRPFDSAQGKPEGAIPFKSLIPLEEIIADAFGVGVASKRVREEYEKLIQALDSEFQILLDTDDSTLKSATLPEIAEGIKRVREGKVKIEPGYDGEYGKIKIFEEGEQKAITTQKSLF